MKKLLIVLSFTFLYLHSTSVLAFKISNTTQKSFYTPSTLPTNLPKIPSYLGLGYHILLGNPFANHVD